MFNVFDVFSIIVAGLGAYVGFETGVLSGIFYLSSGFVGLWAAQKYAPEPGASFYLVFLAGAAVAILLGFVVGRVFKKMLLGTADRFAGAFMGLLLGMAIIGTVVLPVSSHLGPRLKRTVFSSYTGSRMVPWLQKAFPKVKQFELKELLPLSSSSRGK